MDNGWRRGGREEGGGLDGGGGRGWSGGSCGDRRMVHEVDNDNCNNADGIDNDNENDDLAYNNGNHDDFSNNNRK